MAEVQKRSRWSRFLRKFRDILIAGLVVTVPIGLTIWIFAWLFTQIDQLLRPLVKLVFGREIVGVGFGVIVIVVLIVGAIATNNLGKRIIRWGESLLGKIPITRTIYDGIRQIIQSFSDPGKTGFMQVVMVQYPRKGVYTIGFVTNEHVDQAGVAQRLEVGATQDGAQPLLVAHDVPPREAERLANGAQDIRFGLPGHPPPMR